MLASFSPTHLYARRLSLVCAVYCAARVSRSKRVVDSRHMDYRPDAAGGCGADDRYRSYRAEIPSVIDRMMSFTLTNGDSRACCRPNIFHSRDMFLTRSRQPCNRRLLASASRRRSQAFAVDAHVASDYWKRRHRDDGAMGKFGRYQNARYAETRCRSLYIRL